MEQEKELQSISDVVTDLEANASGISENVVKEFQGGEGEGGPVENDQGSPSLLPFNDSPLPEIKDLRDKYDRAFDPSLHVTDALGNPVTNKGKEHFGKLKIRPGVKAPGPEKESVLNIPKEPEPIQEEPQDQSKEEPKAQKAPLSPEVAGKIAARYTQAIGVMIGGEEWHFIKDKRIGMDEERDISEAYGFYFEQKGVKDISPGWLLAIVLMNYSLLRFSMPKTQTRLSKLKYKALAFFYWVRGKRYNGSRVDIRDNGERQDNAGQDDLPGTDKEGVENSDSRPAPRSWMERVFSSN